MHSIFEASISMQHFQRYGITCSFQNLLWHIRHFQCKEKWINLMQTNSDWEKPPFSLSLFALAFHSNQRSNAHKQRSLNTSSESSHCVERMFVSVWISCERTRTCMAMFGSVRAQNGINNDSFVAHSHKRAQRILTHMFVVVFTCQCVSE